MKNNLTRKLRGNAKKIIEYPKYLALSIFIKVSRHQDRYMKYEVILKPCDICNELSMKCYSYEIK